MDYSSLSSDEDFDENIILFNHNNRKMVKTYTVEEAIDHIGFGKFQMIMFAICGLFSATDALEMLLLSVLSPELRCEWQLPDWQIASLTTSVFIGMFIGSFLWGSFSDKYGRQPIMKIAAAFVLFYGLLTAKSPNIWWVMILRAIVGFGFGGAVQSFTLLCEYLPSKKRAKVLIIYGTMWSLGSVFEIMMAYLIIPRYGWRWLVALSALPSFITLLTIWKLPESARYLLAMGEQKEAISVLKYIANMNKSSLPDGQLIESQKVESGSFLSLFVSDYRRTTFQLLIMWFGVASVYYGIILSQSQILEMGGICGQQSVITEGCSCKKHSSADYVSMIISTFGELAVVPINFFLVDRVGRKNLLSLNFLFASVFCLLLHICASVSLLTFVFFAMRSFISGVFNIIYLYTGEVFPTTVRSLGLGSCSSMARVGCMITPFIAQVLMIASARLAISFYAAICLICAIASFLLPIETFGRQMPQSHFS